MLNISDSRFITVFPPDKPSVTDKSVNVILSSYKREKDVSGNLNTVHMSWQGHFVGKAYEAAKSLKKGDKIDIVSGTIETHYVKETKQRYNDVFVFEFKPSVTSKSNSSNT